MNEGKKVPAVKRHSLPVSLPIEYFHRSRTSATINNSKSNSTKVSEIPEPRAAKDSSKHKFQKKRLEHLRMARKLHQNETNYHPKLISRGTNTDDFFLQGKVEKIDTTLEYLVDIVENKPNSLKSKTSTIEIQTDEIEIVRPDEMADFKEFRKKKEINTTKPFVADFLAEFASFGQRFKEFFSELYTMCQIFFKEYTGIDNRTYVFSNEKRLLFLNIVKELITMITTSDDVKKEHLNKNSSTVDLIVVEDNNNNTLLQNDKEKSKDPTPQSEPTARIQDQTAINEEQAILEQALANIMEPKEPPPPKKLQNENQFTALQQNNMKLAQNNFAKNTLNNQQYQRKLPRTSFSATSLPSVQQQRNQLMNTQPTQALQQLQQNQQLQMYPNTGHYHDYQNKIYRSTVNVRDTPYHQKTQMNGKKVWQQQPFEQMLQAPPPQIPYYQQNPQQLFQQQMYYQQNFNAP